MAKVTVKVSNIFTSAGKHVEGDIIDLPDAEVKAINSSRKGALQGETVLKKAASQVKRARNKNGTLKSDDPSTPNINEAWEKK